MTEKEKKLLQELLDKKEQEEKADRDFFKQVRSRKDEVLKELKVSERLADYDELKCKVERLMRVMDREFSLEGFEQYVALREQKKAEKGNQ